MVIHTGFIEMYRLLKQMLKAPVLRFASRRKSILIYYANIELFSMFRTCKILSLHLLSFPSVSRSGRFAAQRNDHLIQVSYLDSVILPRFSHTFEDGMSSVHYDTDPLGQAIPVDSSRVEAKRRSRRDTRVIWNKIEYHERRRGLQ